MNKIPVQLVACVFIYTLASAALATETVKNEHKNIWNGNTLSNADIASHTDGDFPFAVDTPVKPAASHQQMVINDRLMFQQMEQRHRLMLQQQLEAYKLYLQRERHRSAANSPESDSSVLDAMQTRRKENLKYMEERRSLIKKMMDERRRAAEDKRKMMLQKMHQTNTTSELAKKV